MRLPSTLALLFTLLHVGLVLSHLVAGEHVLLGRQSGKEEVRNTSIIKDYPGQGSLPSLEELIKLNQTNGSFLNVKNIQGDILIGMKKPIELFFFFQINDPKTFKAVLKENIIPLVTTTAQLISPPSAQPLAMLNVAFSASGLKILNVLDPLNDPAFSDGQYADAKILGDPGTTNWVKGLTGTATHGVFLIASDKDVYIDNLLKKLLTYLGTSITERHRLRGNARPAPYDGREHFGWLDGISQPAVAGFATNILPGQSLIFPGTILLNEPGDSTKRPDWARDGSFLAFRQLQQFVPEFGKFLLDNPIQNQQYSLSPAEGSELLGARIIGRWKGGAPVDLASWDDPVLGSDPHQNNNFDFSHPGYNIASDQTHCPFSAHIRKTRPRADQQPENLVNQILRAGIPYGPEVVWKEALANKTASERGLAFVGYQSDLSLGFRFQQIKWANDVGFPTGKIDPTPGYDPIIGQNNGGARIVSGLDQSDPNHDFTLLFDYVRSRGGEYFFSPSLSALSNTISV